MSRIPKMIPSLTMPRLGGAGRMFAAEVWFVKGNYNAGPVDNWREGGKCRRVHLTIC